MGIRVHKAIGYGLIDFKGVNDNRLNINGYLGVDYDGREKWTKEDFLKFYEANIDINILSRSIEKDFEPYRSVIFDEECIKTVLLISPSYNKDWQRYDNIIDYLEEKSIDRFQVLTSGIWPYVGRYTDLRTHCVIEQEEQRLLARELLFSYNSALDIKSRKVKKVYLGYATEYAKELGFNTLEEALNNIIPLVPEDIILLCKWLNLFKGDNTIMELRPMLYVYWS